MELTRFSRIKWEKAIDLRKRGQFREAEDELKEALDEQPESPALRASLAQVYLRQERLIEARSLADSILAENPQYPESLYVLGEIFSRQNRLEDALQSYRQAALGDKRPYLFLRIARTLRRMERYEEALATLEPVLLSKKDNRSFLKEKALTLNRMGRSEAALAVYEELRRLDPGDNFVRKEVVRLKSENRSRESTIQELEKVIQIPSQKNDAQMHGLLGQELKDSGRLLEAAAAFHRAGELEPGNPYFTKQEGWCYYGLGEYAKAVECLSLAFQKDPHDYYVRGALQKIYTSTGRIRDFVHLLEAILKEHPDQVKLMGILNSMKKKMAQEERETQE
jgi:tetratricopeptide (TPR) repeat protein